MAKFKVGDRVNYVHGTAAEFYNKIGGREITADGRNIYTFDDGGCIDVKSGDEHGGDYELELVTPATASPIRTVTKREIVAGKYGNVEIDEVGKTYVHVDSTSIYYASDLRAAATLFNELADVLDENAKEAA